jgi:hypothetical protein
MVSYSGTTVETCYVISYYMYKEAALIDSPSFPPPHFEPPLIKKYEPNISCFIIWAASLP